MKLIMLCLTFGTMMLLVFVTHDSKNKTSHLPLTLPMHDTIQFASQIQPILVNRCSPCHFPGGKMYERLPFDIPETILNLKERLLKRIKDEKENSLITAFIDENKKQ
jgi:hypothetical protein